MVREGSFRKDLYYRLNVFQIPVPSLVERRDDIPLLIDHFIRKYAEKHTRPARHINAATMDFLLSHDWPGNIRELEHVIERAVILSNDVTITSAELPEELKMEAKTQLMPLRGKSLPEILKEFEQRLIESALNECGGIQARAARKLGISRSNLNYRIKKLQPKSDVAGQNDGSAK